MQPANENPPAGDKTLPGDCILKKLCQMGFRVFAPHIYSSSSSGSGFGNLWTRISKTRLASAFKTEIVRFS